ncbi:DUF6000 family protein [Streptomyces sp. NPDC087844]|uniref:DUF6000 family protein n=1 Tax=Streptomyces sp. NPDC087844 TaxID=3365805 RepID=UPI003813DBCB
MPERRYMQLGGSLLRMQSPEYDGFVRDLREDADLIAADEIATLLVASVVGSGAGVPVREPGAVVSGGGLGGLRHGFDGLVERQRSRGRRGCGQGQDAGGTGRHGGDACQVWDHAEQEHRHGPPTGRRARTGSLGRLRKKRCRNVACVT